MKLSSIITGQVCTIWADVRRSLGKKKYIYIYVFFQGVSNVLIYFFYLRQTVTNGFLFTASSYASLPVVLAKEADQEPKLIRPKDLPVYSEEPKEKKM